MNAFLPSSLPVPGPVWGAYPRRPALPSAGPSGWPERMADSLVAAWQHARRHVAGRGHQALMARAREHQAAWLALSPELHRHRLSNLRARLARDGLRGAVMVEALGCVSAAGERHLGRNPFDAQLQAALILLDNRLAEMATGEGKTYAAALAAAVAALSGVPVHVITANDYLAHRDAAAMRPLFDALRIRVGTVTGASDTAQRRSAYACDITYCTAREVAFDHLRDELSGAAFASPDAPAGAPPLLRGLCMAVVDEADSVLIDEATMPLVLSEPVSDPAQRALCFQAMALARQLHEPTDFHVDHDARRIDFTEAGRDRVAARVSAPRANEPGVWQHARLRRDLVSVALEALHLVELDRHYVVRDGGVQLLDATTGRAAPGRVWSRGLQTMVELKEGCKPSNATVTRAQITYQRFFPRYLRLCGMSGTLAEASVELWSTYRLQVMPVAPRRPSQRVAGPRRLFRSTELRRIAAVSRVMELHAAGRPVLVGTDSVLESQVLSTLLGERGIEHRVLNARHDAEEAQIVASAGLRGAVTVATHMAGRGTDIELGEGVSALGGLHVLSCQDSPSRRLDRQLLGRAARQGDPGSHELWQALDGPLHHRSSWLLGRRKWCDRQGAVRLPQGWLERLAVSAQRHHESKNARQRRQLLEQDLEWERRMTHSA